MEASRELRSALVEATPLSESDFDRASAAQAESGRSLTEALLELELVREPELLEALGRVYGLPFRGSLSHEDVDAELASKLPIGFAKTHHLILLARNETSLQLALSDPLLIEPLDDLRLLFPGLLLEPVLVPRRTILSCINSVYDRASSADELREEFTTEDLDELAMEIIDEPQDLLEVNESSGPIIRLVNSLLQQAVKERASDIHIEPHERELVVRFRTDDMLYEPVRPLPKEMQQAVASRVKIMGGLDIAEKRLPQDGRIVLKIAGRDYDVRLSSIPTQYGERLVLRLLPRSQELLRIDRIGMAEAHQKTLRRLIRRSNGIVLVTGPTGSGKTTTLYAALSDINSREKNILTIEEPVEIRLDGIAQIEVRPQIGLTFASGLRSFLRQDPNVILVGEIRDLETAEIAIQASLTGHLVFSTIHTNDAAGAVTRLIDMGVEPFLIASSLSASLAQRLVRRLCKNCREPHTPDASELRELGVAPEALATQPIYRAVGCDSCNHKGYRGRTAIFEILEMDDLIRPLVTRGIDSKTIGEQAVRGGMRTMREDGASKVLAGETTVEEILRVSEETTVVSEPDAS
ncbi:MAG: type II secretion system ATPase GspE [Myxococcales bacterium]|nr:type II secretion system ATPase GspE [Myxococcales bacterium]